MKDLQDDVKGIIIGGKNYTNLRYAEVFVSGAPVHPTAELSLHPDYNRQTDTSFSLLLLYPRNSRGLRLAELSLLYLSDQAGSWSHYQISQYNK